VQTTLAVPKNYKTGLWGGASGTNRGETLCDSLHPAQARFTRGVPRGPVANRGLHNRHSSPATIFSRLLKELCRVCNRETADEPKRVHREHGASNLAGLITCHMAPPLRGSAQFDCNCCSISGPWFTRGAGGGAGEGGGGGRGRPEGLPAWPAAVSGRRGRDRPLSRWRSSRARSSPTASTR